MKKFTEYIKSGAKSAVSNADVALGKAISFAIDKAVDFTMAKEAKLSAKDTSIIIWVIAHPEISLDTTQSLLDICGITADQVMYVAACIKDKKPVAHSA